MNQTSPVPAAEAPLLVVETIEPGIVRLLMNRPRAYNALSSALMTELQAALDDLAGDPAARVLVIEGAGPGFSAGHDLKEVRALPDSGARRTLMAQCSRLMASVVRSPKPVIAKVHGTATAAGCQLVASCDLAVAADTATFGTPGVNIGLFCHTPMVALGRNVGRKQAMEMLVTGERIDAATARDFGLVNRAVPAERLEEETLVLARRIASKSSFTLKIGKQAFYRQLELGLDDAYAYASEVMVENMLAHDAGEGIQAFIDKRAPVWQDR